MREGYDLPPLMFTRDELVALVSGARMIQAWGGAAMAGAAEEALIKIKAVLPDSMRPRADNIEIHAIADEMTPAVQGRIDILEKAIEERQRMKLSYETAEAVHTDRLVRPLALWFWGKVWTLVAWCELRDDFRMFRQDRISEIEPSGGTFRLERGKTLKDFCSDYEECEQ